MTDQPDGAKLLAEARRVLLEELLAELPDHQRFNGLMIANAMAIARRELEAAGMPQTGASQAESQETTTIEDIRLGRRDGERALYEALLLDARDRVLISNPKRLEII